jgi:hypothetical protein
LSKSPSRDIEIDSLSDWPIVLSSVRSYWLSKCETGSMPRRSDISPAQLKVQLPYILLADVVDGGKDFRYRLIGTQLTQFFPANPSGKLMSETLTPFGEATVAATLESYRNVAQRLAPMRLSGSGSWFGQDPKHFDAFLAPLSDDGTTVNMILGVFIFVWDQEHQFRSPPPAPQIGHTAP